MAAPLGMGSSGCDMTSLRAAATIQDATATVPGNLIASLFLLAKEEEEEEEDVCFLSCRIVAAATKDRMRKTLLKMTSLKPTDDPRKMSPKQSSLYSVLPSPLPK